MTRYWQQKSAKAKGAIATADLLRQRRDGVLKAGAQKIIDMNLENMVSVNGHAKEWARWTETALYVFMGCGLLLGLLLMALVGRWILQPLQSMTRSVREIEAGNLNLVVAVKSKDEVGQLAEAFNSMAAKLRAFRETDQAKLLRTQQTTQLAIDSLPDAVAVINPDGSYRTIQWCRDEAVQHQTTTRGGSTETGMAVRSVYHGARPGETL